MTDDRVLLVRQYRLPAGRSCSRSRPVRSTVDEDGAIEDPLSAARRELEEETGMRARIVATPRSTFYTAPGFTEELMHLYLATDLDARAGGRLGPDEDEHLLLERRAVARCARGRRARRDRAMRNRSSGLFWLARLRDAGAR